MNEELTAPTVTGTITVGGTYPYCNGYNPSVYVTPYYYQVAPVECAGDVHVFPCPHCERCKCGQATVKRKKK